MSHVKVGQLSLKGPIEDPMNVSARRPTRLPPMSQFGGNNCQTAVGNMKVVSQDEYLPTPSCWNCGKAGHSIGIAVCPTCWNIFAAKRKTSSVFWEC